MTRAFWGLKEVYPLQLRANNIDINYRRPTVKFYIGQSGEDSAHLSPTAGPLAVSSKKNPKV